MAKPKTYIQSRKHGSSSLTQASVGNLVACATALAALGLPVAHAQSKPETTLREVKVEAAQESGYEPAQLSSPKYTAPLAETTQTISVLKEQVLKDQGATTLTEALRNIPGAGTFDAGEGRGGPTTGDAIYMRGFDTSNSIYVDGVRDLGAITRDIFNTEQIEVTKGAAGTDYGRSSPAGSINLVTKQPTLENSFGASLGLGSGKYKRATADLNRAINETTAFRLNVLGQDAGVAGRDRVKNDRWGIAPSLAFGLGTDTRVFLDLLHVKQNNTPESSIPLIGFPGYTGTNAALSNAPKVSTSNYYGTSDAYDNSTATMATARVERDISADTTLRNTLRWGHTKQDAFNVTPSGVTMVNAKDPSTWTVGRLGAYRHLENEILTNQTNVSTRFQTGAAQHNLSAGLELTREKQSGYAGVVMDTNAIPRVNAYNPAFISSGITVPVAADSEWKTDTVALYAFDTIKLGEQWQLNAGLRYDHYKTTYTTPTAAALKGDGNLFTYKLGALYKVAPNGNIYLNYAQSQQPPGSQGAVLGTYSLSSSASSASNPLMSPQKAKTLEFGSKWELADKRLLLSGALFRTDISNELYLEDNGTYSQIGKKRVTGLELSATGQITKDWNVIAAYTHQKAKISQGASVTTDASSSLAWTPENAVSLWTTYNLPAIGLTLGGGARYSDGFKRTGSASANAVPGESQSYVVFDALATYRVSKNVDLQLNLFNLFNKKYIASMNRMGTRYVPGVERSARLTMNVRF